MTGFVGWGWWHTHRLSSGDRLSVKNEQFWLSISANLYVYKHTNAHTHRMSNIHTVDAQTPKREILSEISKRNEKGKATHYVYYTLIKIYFIKHKL